MRAELIFLLDFTEPAAGGSGVRGLEREREGERERERERLNSSQVLVALQKRMYSSISS